MAAAEIADMGLLERGRELAVLDGLLAAVAGGAGGLALVHGQAGIGKSALLTAVRRRARGRGISVLAARGEEIERTFAFGVARQLLERPARARLAAGMLTGAAELAAVPLGVLPAPEPRSPEESFASRHGLYWLAADLAAAGPMLLTVDDAQWADSPSLEWLAFLAGRLEELAIAVVVAVRDEEDVEPALAKLELEPAAQKIVPRHLSEAAVEELTARTLAIDPQPELVSAVYRAAGGNPLWTRELLRALLADEPVAHLLDSRQVAETTPLSVTRAVLVRLGQLGSDAVELARALAVLGSDVEIVDVATIAQLEPLAAHRIADVLERAGILGPGPDRLTFGHPIVRQAIYADLSPEQRSAAHTAAAEALAARGAEPEQVASHLMHAPPSGAASAVERLREAARVAVARGAPATAVRYLRRAQLEQPDKQDSRLLYELGTAEAMTSNPAALEHLLAAYRAADPGLRPRIAVDTAQRMLVGLRVEEAVTFLERALEEAEAGNREGRLRLTAALLTTRFFGGDAGGLPVSVPSGRTPGERALLSGLAPMLLVRAEPTGRALDMARAAWSDGLLLADEGPSSPYVTGAIMGALACDAFEEASTWLAATLADAQRRGAVSGFVTAVLARAYLAYRRGNVSDALADARVALDVVAGQAEAMFAPGTLAFLIDALIETGDLDDAAAALHAHGWNGRLPAFYMFDVLLDRRGRLRVAQGRLEEGASDLWQARRRLAWIENPAINASIDSHVGLALAALGRRQEARAIVTDELERARRVGLPRQIAVALRAAALIDQPPDLERLRQSADMAARARARLEQARALTDLGAALRRGGRRTDAREPLRRALEISTRTGARVLAKRARQELLAAGGRPRRTRLSGRDALTPSERRIAELAAAGQSNRRIAQDLFVTVRTVEMHLSGAYRKLDIRSRAELTGALDPDVAPAEETPTVSAPKLFGRST